MSIQSIDYTVEVIARIYGGKGFGVCHICQKPVTFLASKRSPIEFGYLWFAPQPKPWAHYKRMGVN